MAARITFMMQRMPFEPFVTPEWQKKMETIENCTNCGQCRASCPYELDTPRLLKNQLVKYRELVKSGSA